MASVLQEPAMTSSPAKTLPRKAVKVARLRHIIPIELRILSNCLL